MVSVSEMVKEREVEAVRWLLSPAWVAVMVQVPAEIGVTVVPETVHRGNVVEENVTAKPVDAVALTVKVPVPSVLLESAANVTV